MQQPRFVTGWLVVVALLCIGLLMVTYVLSVHTYRGRLLDGASLRGAADSPTSVSDVIERLLDVVSVSSLLVAAALVVMIALLRLRRDLAVAATVVIVGANATTQVLKRWVLSRPDLGIDETTPATLNSLPSGHSTVAFSVALALVLVLPTRLRPAAAVFGVVYAAVAAVATLSAGWHRPSDSLAAFFVVGAWAAAAQAVVLRRSASVGPVGEPAGAGHIPTARRLAVAAAYLLAFGAVVAGVVVATQLDSYGTAAQVLALVAAAGAIGGTAAALMAALVAVRADVVDRVDKEPPRARGVPPRIAAALRENEGA